MMKTSQKGTGQSRVLTGEQARQLPPAKFERFTSRPVNYFQGIVRESSEPAFGLTREDVDRQVAQQLEVDRAAFANGQETAYRKGFEEGLVRGREEGNRQIEPAIELLREWGQILQAEKEELARRYESEVVELAFQIAERILGSEITTRPEAIVDVAKQALKKIVNVDEVVLRVHPDDQKILEESCGELSREVSSGKPLEFRADTSIARGGCVVETESGMLDAQLGSQVDQLRALLKEPATGEDE
jgi:flagellar biosynthesis/type III secretory pathway protein FliH